MKINRFYCENITPDQVVLAGSEAHHAIHVMRVKPADKVELFDGKGSFAVGTVVDVGRKTVSLEVGEIEHADLSGRAQVVMAASFAKGQRNDWMVSKCTELGVDHIAGVVFDRTVKQPKGKSADKRNHNLAVTAAKQCKRLTLPKFSMHNGLEDAVAELKNEYPDAVLVFGGWSESAVPVCKVVNDIYNPGGNDLCKEGLPQDSKPFPSKDLHSQGNKKKCRDVIAIIGPEGGFSDEEVEFLKSAGAVEVQLTKTILRIETAAVAFASIFCTARDVCL
ncbi:Ribosomal RNA small subunit methyltransferase E [Anaerohalosphaera lusitana]|uniref:Ribosomal RNA small subunit methyltransferase E n=1 Tax=Anaerohalosphaera lusitana TaxID=1936003 RepID=A0A1U9NHU8_9BACT|nr:RsmE family RNA methyltransferase [Anaerohalosphaera lusitana]AQT67501.1 Ribosomal RNA small subunit methyltransferase E [Anaerohalosphaera lusitana]